MRRAGGSILKRGSIPVAVLLVLVVLLSASSGLYAGASFFAQQAPNVTVTTTILTTTTSWTTSTLWSTVTAVILGVWTTVQYTTSTSTVTVTGSTASSSTASYSNGKIVTANGNARITTAQSKFGDASGLFNGNGAYLSTPDSADWYFGTGDFTIDFWVRFNVLPSAGGFQIFFSQRVDDNNVVSFQLYNAAGTYKWRWWGFSGGGNIFAIAVNSPGLSTNTWYHVALVRSGNLWYFFQNGTQCGVTATDADAVPDLAAPISIGRYGTTLYFVNGWLDELRISKGVARWTSNFTPSSAPFDRDSSTVLLLHMDGTDGSTTFVDG